MLFRADLRLFVCGFEVNACTHEGSWSVVRLCGQRQVRCHWQAEALWQMASCVHLAHGAVQDKAGSFPSAKTTFNLPTAIPKGNFSRASARLRPVSTIQLFAISLRSRLCTVSGLSSAIFQLPSQISRSGGAAVSGFLAGHCRLGGKAETAPVGTPCCKNGSRAMSGSPQELAKACSRWSLYGCPASGLIS